MSGRPPGPFVLRRSDEPHLAAMPPKLANPLRLVHQGMSYRDVAVALCLPINTVKTRIHRARQHVAKMRGRAALANAIREGAPNGA